MKAPFHYLVKAKTIKLKIQKQIEFVEFEERFEDENPLIARESAFDYYQQQIEVILKAKNIPYISDKQATDALKEISSEGISVRLNFGGRDIDFPCTFGCGFGVFMVIDKPIAGYIIEDHASDEYMIHGFGGLGWANDPKSVMAALNHEYWYYNECHIDISEFKQNVNFYEYDIEQAESNTILKTPFDWSGFNKPYSNLINDHEFSATDILMLNKFIDCGECKQIDFKPSLLYNHKTGKGGISIKGIIAKIICGFLNSMGGFLFIGINNKGEIHGLGYDYNLAGEKKPRDYFRLEFDQMLEHFLSLSVKSNVSGQFYEVEGKDIFVVTVLPSKHRPIFLNGHENKEFYVRFEHSNKQVTDIEEIANYCIDTWTS